MAAAAAAVTCKCAVTGTETKRTKLIYHECECVERGEIAPIIISTYTDFFGNVAADKSAAAVAKSTSFAFGAHAAAAVLRVVAVSAVAAAAATAIVSEPVLVLPVAEVCTHYYRCCRQPLAKQVFEVCVAATNSV